MPRSRLSSGWERSCAGKAFRTKPGGAQRGKEEEFDFHAHFPSFPCPALSYANQLAINRWEKDKSHPHHFHLHFYAWLPGWWEMPKGIFSQWLTELKLKGIMLSGSLVLLRLPFPFPLCLLCTGACMLLGKEKKLLSFSEFHLSVVLLHTVILVDKIYILKNCFSLTAGSKLIFKLTSVLGFPNSRFSDWAWNREQGWGIIIY